MKKVIVFVLILVILLGGKFYFDFVSYRDGNLHIVFCNVGQGDGIFIRTPGGKQILVDGGPDEKVLSCLSGHSPFWQRSLDLMLLSHPHADHLNGLIIVLQRYITRYFGSENLSNKTAGFRTLNALLKEKKISFKQFYAGDKISLADGVTLRILSPDLNLLKRTSPNGVVGESSEFANLIILVEYKNFTMLLTGDSQAPQIEAVTKFLRKPIDILQVPHHGSRTGLSNVSLQTLLPKMAVISVGKNSYGHPSLVTLSLLKSLTIPAFRTDQKGDIEVISDGKNFKTRVARP